MIYHLDRPSVLLGIVVALLVGLLVHDYVQTWVAHLLGDRSAGHAKRRLPASGGGSALGQWLRPHFDVYGVVAAVVAGYGWGAPVPVDDRWRARRWRTFAALVAGPIAYVALAVLVLLVYRAAGFGDDFLHTFLATAAQTLCGQAVLAILPVYPVLDGGRALFAVGPQSIGWQKARYQLADRNIGMLVAMLVVILPRLLPPVTDVPASWGFHLFVHLADWVVS